MVIGAVADAFFEGERRRPRAGPRLTFLTSVRSYKRSLRACF
jgi:hypothetical protein